MGTGMIFLSKMIGHTNIYAISEEKARIAISMNLSFLTKAGRKSLGKLSGRREKLGPEKKMFSMAISLQGFVPKVQMEIGLALNCHRGPEYPGCALFHVMTVTV